MLRAPSSLSNLLIQSNVPGPSKGPAWIPTMALLAIVSLLSARESAASEGADPAERWLPSLSIGLVDVYEERAHGFIDSSVGFSRGYEESGDVTLLRFGAEVMSPRYDGLFGRPRFFASFGLQVAPTRLVANSGQLSGTENPQAAVDQYLFDRANVPGTMPRGADDFPNQGSDISARWVNPSFYAALGMAFPLPLEGVDIRLRPSFQYSGDGVRVQGRLYDVEELAPDVFNVTQIKETDFQIYHALGLGFEVETMLKPQGRITLSVFAQTRFLWSVGSRDVDFGDDAGVVSFSYHRQRSSWRGGAGIRIGWQGGSVN